MWNLWIIKLWWNYVLLSWDHSAAPKRPTCLAWLCHLRSLKHSLFRNCRVATSNYAPAFAILLPGFPAMSLTLPRLPKGISCTARRNSWCKPGQHLSIWPSKTKIAANKKSNHINFKNQNRTNSTTQASARCLFMVTKHAWTAGS